MSTDLSDSRVSGRSAVVITTGVANLASVIAALHRLEIRPTLSADPDLIAEASHVILPGVGAFGSARAALRARGLDEVIRDRVARDRPLLGICLGMQLLCSASAEHSDQDPLDLEASETQRGLEICSGVIERFATSSQLRVPHFGWNRVTPTVGSRFLTEGVAYYAHSYRLSQLPVGFEGAYTNHGEPFVAALERGTLLACQFHPELSGRWGAELIKSWFERTQ